MRLYHHTSHAHAAEIIRRQSFSKRIDPGMSAHYVSHIWASNRPGGHAAGYGPVAVAFDARHADLDDVFPDGEEHYTVHVRHARNFKIHSIQSEGLRTLVFPRLSEGLYGKGVFALLRRHLRRRR